MRLNSDCVRDILLAIEKDVDYHRILELKFDDTLPDNLQNILPRSYSTTLDNVR